MVSDSTILPTTIHLAYFVILEASTHSRDL